MTTFSGLSNFAKLHSNLDRANNQLAQSAERLSSGLRINNASDDIGARLLSDRTSNESKLFRQAMRNINDGISLVTKASSALDVMSSLVERLTELAKRATNTLLTSAQRTALDSEAQLLAIDLMNIKADTEFNKSQIFQTVPVTTSIQAGITAGDQISFTLGSDLNSLTLDAEVTTSSFTGTFNAAVTYVSGQASSDFAVIDSYDFNNSGLLTLNDTDLTPAITTTIIGAAYDRNVAGNGPTTLFVIDRNDSQIGMLGGINGNPSPNGGVVTDLRPLGFTLNQSHDGGFDISSSGIAYAALSNFNTGIIGLYSFGLVNTFHGAIGNGAIEIYSLAILQPDTDGDGIRDAADNCANTPNAGQNDFNANGLGDDCDPDGDGDGLPNQTEAALGSDSFTADSDGDGLIDGQDACPILPTTLAGGCPRSPETQITKAPKSSRNRNAVIEFGSSLPNSKFECKLDRGGFGPCSSPKRFRNLRVGRHSFQVRALTTDGTIDLSAASSGWKIRP